MLTGWRRPTVQELPVLGVIGLSLATVAFSRQLAQPALPYPHPTLWLATTLTAVWVGVWIWLSCSWSLRLAPGPRAALVAALAPVLGLWLPALVAEGSPLSDPRFLLPAALASGAVLAGLLAVRKGVLRWSTLGAGLVTVSVLWAATSRLHPGLDLGPTAMLLAGTAWAGYVVLALVGWGRLVARLLGTAACDWGLAAAWGAGALLAAGGVFSLTGLFSPALVKLLLAAGAAHTLIAIATTRLKNRSRWRVWATNPALATAGAVFAAILLLHVLGSVNGNINDMQRFRAFDLHDDVQAYLAFPEKLLQQGSLGAEPFEPRRMLNLGGQSVLQTLILVALPVRQIHLLDGGVAVVMLAGLVWGWARRERLPLPLTTILMLVALTLPHLEARGNTSSLMTGVVMLFAWFRTVTWARTAPTGWTRVALAALMLAGVVSLKSTFIPFAAFAFFGLAVFPDERTWRARLGDALATAAVALLLLAPWMISVLASSGTLLYPLLGRGFHATHDFPGFSNVSEGGGLGWHEVMRMVIRQLGHVWVVLLLLFAIPDRRHRSAQAFGVAAVLGAVAIVWLVDATLNRSLVRYILPFSHAALLALLAASLSGHSRAARRWPLGTIAGVVVAIGILVTGSDVTQRQLLRLVDNLGPATADASLATPAEKGAYAQMLEGIPPRAPVLARLRLPFELDFERHRIFLMGFAGMSSPPPGLPLFAGSEPLAAYLRASGIRFLAYTYDPLAGETSLLNLNEAEITQRYSKSRTRWAMLRYHQDFDANVRKLMRSYHREFDSGREVVLDLERRVASIVPLPAGSHGEGLGEEGWSQSRVSVRGLNIEVTGPAPALIVRTRGWDPRGTEAAQVQPRLQVNGVDLPLIATGPRHFAFDLTAVPAATALTIEVAPLGPEAFGAAPGTGTLGLDLAAIEMVEDLTALGEATRTPRQPLPSRIDPAVVWDRNGFYQDNNWTNGNGLLRSLDVEVAPAHRMLVLACRGGHPWLGEPERLRLRVVANGIELAFQSRRGLELTFALPRGIVRIEEIRIYSATFVPADKGTSRDTRTLGFPVDFIELRSEGT